MDENVQRLVETIKKVAEQQPDFLEELKKALPLSDGDAENALAALSDERIDHIYEYCIEDVLKHQAAEFYNEFPIPSLIDRLTESFIKMEKAHRCDDFYSFSLYLFKQVEAIDNYCISMSNLQELANKLWWHCAYIKVGDYNKKKEFVYFSDSNLSPAIRLVEDKSPTVAELVFYGNHYDMMGKPAGYSKAYYRYEKAFKEPAAIDNLRIVVYFIGYLTMLKKNSDYKPFVDFCKIFEYIYKCRCKESHEGKEIFQKEKDMLAEIDRNRSFYYFKFIAALTQFVDMVRKGLPQFPTICEKCKDMQSKEARVTPPQQLTSVE